MKPYQFSVRSIRHLRECHEDLQTIAHEAIKLIDFAVIEGHRSQPEQDRAYERGFSLLKWPESKHNKYPSLAMDIIPYVDNRFVGWDNQDAFIYLAGHVRAVGAILLAQGKVSHRLRWGGDWQDDLDMNNSTLFDAPHFELIAP